MKRFLVDYVWAALVISAIWFFVSLAIALPEEAYGEEETDSPDR